LTRPNTYSDRPSYSAFGGRGPRRHWWSGSLITLAALGSLAWVGEGPPKRHAAGTTLAPEAGVQPVAPGAESPPTPRVNAPFEMPACVAKDTPTVDEPTLPLCSAVDTAEQDSPLVTAPLSAAASSCPDGMVEVQGEYCPALAQFCTRFIDQPERDRCAEFKPGSRCYGATVPMHFCIDRYEYPNRAGATPVVATTWEDAAAQCKSEGKRLCRDTEWTLACEGEDRNPYPYGNTRDATACNIDKLYILPDNNAYANPATRDAEIARLDQRELSGSRDRCVSQYGVYDMTGNVDEWVINEGGNAVDKPFLSGLKGGYWGPVRNRCRPMTVDHNMWHSGYQIGFRCCSDAS
jgi:formylglycine-generating enzyme